MCCFFFSDIEMGDFAVSHVSELRGVVLWTDHMFKGLLYTLISCVFLFGRFALGQTNVAMEHDNHQ